MASILPGYEYDIFISYRQKDNKHDGWVTEFVDNLKGELEATFKEDISVYFDINPHDGLLETHDVDASLKEKLKCLVFIPIISQTYCDSKSFAWQREFVEFNRLAKEDKFGIEIKLASGNVASRVLPIKIHDLDSEDKTLLENELGGYIRGIEFIYKEPGVNRPLKPEDDEKKNQNGTKYLNQINKVANGVKEIITAIKKHSQHEEKVPKEGVKVKPERTKLLKTKIIIASIIVLALIMIGYYVIPKLVIPSEQLEKSIAVLPFINESPVDSNRYFINGIMEEVLTNLQKIKDLRVLSRTSTDQYKGTDRPTIPEIGKKLGVSYVVEGSGQKYGNTFRLRVQLIKAKGKEAHLWAKSYEQEIKETRDIFNIQSQIAQSIAAELKTIITPEEKQLIEKTQTANLTAYDFYQRGYEEFTNYTHDYPTTNREALGKAGDLFKQSLKYDSTFARAYLGLSWVFYYKHYSGSYLSENFLDSMLILANKAITLDSQLADAYTTRGLYYQEKGLTGEAMDEYDKALKYNPNDHNAYANKAYLCFMWLRDFVKGISNMHDAVARNRGSDLPDFLRTLGDYYLGAGFIDKAKYYSQEAFALDRDSTKYLLQLAWIEWDLENFTGTLKMAKQANGNDTTKLIYTWFLTCLPLNYNEEVIKEYKKWIEYSKKTGELLMGDYYRIAIAF
ncbi:MAG: hypothetical protein EPN88_07190, partial [Bacteroidetes bacterium]